YEHKDSDVISIAVVSTVPPLSGLYTTEIIIFGMIRIKQRRIRDSKSIKQRRAWLLLGWVTAERSCPTRWAACKNFWWKFGSHL
ncbi:hypothetical protein J6590_054795, partial [Homalodisca vitripennis]